MSALTIQYRDGAVFLPACGLWLDARRAQTGPERVFVSHAHSDHTAAHREVILTAATAGLMRARIGGQRVEHRLPFGEARRFEGDSEPFQITLLPAGHILGSAMAWIECGGQSLLYTGDFKLRPGFAAEPCQPTRADLLIMETTYGRPEYRFPAAEAVLEDVIRFCRDALDRGETPVLLAYSLGKSQELLAGLRQSGLPIMLHDSVWKMTQVFGQLGVSFPPCERWDPAAARAKVLLCPPQAARAAALQELGKIRRAVITGWAVDSSCRYRYQADAAFALSDHADFPDLVRMVERVAPQKVFTLHGFAADFAQTLRDLGYDAQALSEPEQFLLPLGSSGLSARRR